MAGTSSRIRKKALRDPTYGLKDILVDGRRDEQSAFQAREIESKDTKRDEINEVNADNNVTSAEDHIHMRKDLVQLKERTVVNVENKIILRKSVVENNNNKSSRDENAAPRNATKRQSL